MDTSVGSLSSDAFFDRMDRVISPEPIDAVRALTEVVDALYEAASVRVTSVNNGVAYVRANPEDTVEMPWGHDVFETVGPWENFSTPARDLRLLVAMDVVDGFVARVLRDPARFGVGEELDADALKTTLQDLRDVLLRDPVRNVSYTRTDGSTVTLSLAELLARASALEVAYNPNDCPEGAGGPGGRRGARPVHAALPQTSKKMEAYRGWFRARQRPRRARRAGGAGVPRPDDERHDRVKEINVMNERRQHPRDPLPRPCRVRGDRSGGVQRRPLAGRDEAHPRRPRRVVGSTMRVSFSLQRWSSPWRSPRSAMAQPHRWPSGRAPVHRGAAGGARVVPRPAAVNREVARSRRARAAARSVHLDARVLDLLA